MTDEEIIKIINTQNDAIEYLLGAITNLTATVKILQARVYSDRWP